MKANIDSANKFGMKVKIYNTVHELADRTYELYPLFSLGHEIFPALSKQGEYSTPDTATVKVENEK